MSIERHFRTVEDVELLERWMKTHPSKRPKEMPDELASYLERLQLANTWLLTHGSKRKVWPMLLAHYKRKGIPYSESTARRDVDAAQRLFSTISRFQARWTTEMMIDNLLERMDSCARNDKDKEYAALAAVLDRYLDRADRYAKEDEQAMKQPIPVLAVFDPQEAGIKPDPHIRDKIAQWKAKRQAMEAQRLGGAGISDATFTEEQ